jgi:NADPH:quinone reductase-like Zn-dependent oxidoreductase
MTRTVVKKYGDVVNPECLEAETVTIPEPGYRQILVRVKAVGLNPIDFKIASGNLWLYQPTAAPFYPGSDFSGIVVKCGAGVVLFQVGDDVMGNVGIFEKYDHLKVPELGALGEYVVVHEDRCALKPPHWSFEKAAALPLAGLTARMVVKAAALKEGQTAVVVGGSGGVGSVALQLARRTGARIICVCSGSNADYVKWLGASSVIDYTQGDWAASFAKGLELVDAVLDVSPSGGRSIWDKAKKILPIWGKFVSVNTLDPSLQATTLFKTLVAHQAGNRFLHMVSARPRYTFIDCMTTTPPNVREALDELRGLTESGELDLPTVEVFDFEDVHEGFEKLKTGKVQGKVVVRINS